MKDTIDSYDISNDELEPLEKLPPILTDNGIIKMITDLNEEYRKKFWDKR